MVVTLVHGGVSGTATVTFLAGTLTDTASVTFTGDPDAATASIDTNYITGTTFTTATITVTVVDESGNEVVNGTLVYPLVSSPATDGVSVTGSDCETTGTVDGDCDIAVTASSTTALGEHSIDLRLSAGTTGTVLATVTINVVGA